MGGNVLGLQIGTIVTIFQVLLFLGALFVVPRDRRPSSALAWLLLIVVLPLIGLGLYLLIGSPKLPQERRDKQAAINQRISDRTTRQDTADPAGLDPAWLESVATLNQNLGAMPLLVGNHARLLSGFDDQVAALVDAVGAARDYVHVEFYTLTLDASTAPFFEALAAAVDRGVQVRVLLDHLGSRPYPGYRRTLKNLTRAGVEWRLMLPVQPWRGRYQRPDLRNHRKLVVVDGDTAYLGSLNMIDPSYDTWRRRRRGLRWRDLLVEVEGPVVQEVDALFITDWYCETDDLLPAAPRSAAAPPGDAGVACQIVPSGPRFEEQNNLVLFNSLIYAARERLSLTSPYFVPDESLLTAITTAARRGVAVELFVGEIGDQFLVFHAQHSYYRTLLEAGVRIYLFPAPHILHAKHVSVDDLVTAVGSSNMDIRSFLLDLELTLVTSGREFAVSLHAVEDEYRRLSRELTLDEWTHRSVGHRVVDDLCRLTSAVQ